MIYPICLSCARDAGLYRLMERSLRALGRGDIAPTALYVESQDLAAFEGCDPRTRPPGFAPWGFESSMVKLWCLRDLVGRLGPDATGHVMCVDSDVVWLGGEVFGELRGAAAGIVHQGDGFPHLSGCCMFLPLPVVRMIVTPDPLSIKLEMSREALCYNEDVVLSWLAKAAGSYPFQDLTNRLRCTDWRGALLQGRRGECCMVHLAGEFTELLGVRVAGKWEAPRALAELGVLV